MIGDSLSMIYVNKNENAEKIINLLANFPFKVKNLTKEKIMLNNERDTIIDVFRKNFWRDK